MQNEREKTIAGLKMIAHGLDLVINTLLDEDVVATATKATPVKEVAKEVVEGDSSFDNVSYNDLKKLAKTRGVSAVGTREEIIARINGEPEVAPAEAVTKTAKVSPIKKVSAPVQEELEPESEIVAKVNEATKDMSNEEIADFLTSIGVRASGKREALIAKVVKAVEEGKIDLDETEDEPGVDPSNADPAEDGEEEDIINDLDNPNMTPERADALTAYDASIRAYIKKKEITESDMVEYLVAYFNDDEMADQIQALSLPELIDVYIDTTARFIDDSGEQVEGDSAYMLNGEPACCGIHLTYDDSRNTYVCGRCGQEFEADE